MMSSQILCLRLDFIYAIYLFPRKWLLLLHAANFKANSFNPVQAQQKVGSGLTWIQTVSNSDGNPERCSCQ